MSRQGTTGDTAGQPLELPFRPRARLLQLLGDELIGSPRLAVFELVKNAYDADAGLVRVALENVERRNASIVVEDDGDGMTLETIRDIWLVPGHDHRARQRAALQRTPRGRLPLGEKGLGRFAAHKLGNRIEVVTRAKDRQECVVSINWAELIRRENLSDAIVRVIERDPIVFRGDQTGTCITISELRERNWTRGEVRRLHRQIASISSPFEGASDEFSPWLEVPDHDDWVTDVPDVTALLERAPWRFQFRFDGGRFDWKYRFRGVTGIKLERRSVEETEQPLLIQPERDVDELGIDQRRRRDRPPPVLADASQAEEIGPVKGELYVFDRDAAVLNKLGESRFIKSYLDENGGIRVYRDGMRVYNYGEPGDDWLGLDLRRVNTPARKISRNIVVGAIELSLEDSHALKEKTNREGFVENQALRRLKQIVLGALTPFEAEREKDKNNIRQIISRGQDPETKRIRKPLKALRDAAQRRGVSDELEPLIDKVERDYDELRDTMLRAGASGVNLALIFHEVEHGVRALCDLVEANRDYEAVRAGARELAGVLEGFADLLPKGKRRVNSLEHLVRRVRDINRVRFRKHHVRLVCPALEDGSANAESSFVFSLALGALNNLLDNAFYWLRVRWPEQEDLQPRGRAIYLNISLDLADGPAIVVADTGPGLVDTPDELIRPFFSRRPEGMGLGLYYANLVMELGEGRLAFPDAAEADVPEEFDGAVLALIFPQQKEN